MYFGIQILPTINASSVLNLHSSGKEDENTSITLKLKIKIFDEATVNCSRDDKPNSSKAGVFVFSSTTVPTFTAIFHFSYLLHPEGHRGARQEGSAGLQRKSLALLLNSPGSAALSRVSGYRLLAPASSCNFSVVEKRDSSFSESPSAISRQCRGRQCLRNPRGHFKETVWNKEDEDTKEIFPGLQCDSRSVFFNTEQVQYFYWERTRVPHFTI